MKKFNYALPTTNSFYASFDYGFVWAKDVDDAREKAIHELNYNVEKVNSILSHSDNTLGFSIEICTDELSIEETNSLVDLVIDNTMDNPDYCHNEMMAQKVDIFTSDLKAVHQTVTVAVAIKLYELGQIGKTDKNQWFTFKS